MYYYTILTLHIVFAGIWLINFATEPVLRWQILTNKNKSGERKFISLYLTFANLLGMIGAIGILTTGITLVLNSGYVFFRITFFFQAEAGIRDWSVTGVQTCALPINDTATTEIYTLSLRVSDLGGRRII